MRPIKRAIVLCWIMLVACFVIKLFGGNWFDIVCTNEHFSNFCKYVDENIWIKYAIAFAVYIPQMFMFYCASSCLGNPNKQQKFLILYFVLFSWFSQFIHIYVKFAVEVLVVLACPITLRVLFNNEKLTTQFKKCWYYGIIGFSLNICFQFISLLTKNIGIKITHDSTLVTIILMIDYYIMIILYYCYNKLRKEQ